MLSQADCPQTARLLAAIAGPSLRTLICANAAGVEWATQKLAGSNGEHRRNVYTACVEQLLGDKKDKRVFSGAVKQARCHRRCCCCCCC